MENELRRSGIEVIGSVPWGTHFCQFYHTKQDLIDILVPYFKAGLENNEFCMWITAEPLRTTGARAALRRAVPDLDLYIKKGQIEIIPHTKWYLLGGKFDDEQVLNGWVSKLEEALKRGYSGLRLTGNTFWLERNGWQAFTDYEAKVNDVIGKYKMLAICTYCLDKCNGADVVDVVKNHQFALIKEKGRWDIIESTIYKQAEEALEKTRFILSEGQRIAHVGTFEYTATTAETIWSDEEFRIYGLEPGPRSPSYAELMKSHFHPDDAARVDREFAEALRKGSIYEIEHRIIRPDGEVRDLYNLAHPYFDEQGKFIRYVGVTLDITERKKAAEALWETERDLNRAQAVAQTGSWRLDMQRNVLLWSDENHRIFSIPEGTTMTYETFLSCVHPDDREYVDQKWRAALEGEEYDIEHRIIVGDEVKWVREKAELEFDEQGMLKGGFGTTQDITEHKEAEEQMAFQSKLLDTIEDYVIAADFEGHVTYWGKGTARLLGWQPEEVIGLNAVDLLFPEEFRQKPEELRQLLRSGQSWSGEIAVRRRDGAMVPLLVNSSPVLDKDGRVTSIIAVGKDISELKKVDQMKDEFIGLVSHELRTPLTVITGSLESAMHPGVSPEDAHELIQNAIEGADSLAVILDNMLELSRYQAGRLYLKIGPVIISDVAQSVVQKLKSQGVGHRFSLDSPDDLDRIEADPMRVERILYNLLENATKYSPDESEIMISIRNEGDFVITKVTDQGQGISPDDQKKLFKLFERLEMPTLTEGAGLGLVVCKRLVEAQGGWMKVDSQLGKGSTFTFAFPIRSKKAQSD